MNVIAYPYPNLNNLCLQNREVSKPYDYEYDYG